MFGFGTVKPVKAKQIGFFTALFLPPLAALRAGGIGAFLLNVILTCCLVLPGVIHAVLLCQRYNAAQQSHAIAATIAAAANQQIRQARKNKPSP